MAAPWGYLKRVLAGAIFGLYMAHLLYYLNPQIEITPARLATVTIAYGIICGGLFGSLLWGARLLRLRILGRPDVPGHRRHGFGFVAAAAFASAATYLMHLEVFRIYLPVGAVRILSKATNIIAITAFALLLLWLIERNARANVSRAIFVIGCVLIATSSFFLYQRRERYRTDRKTVVVADVGTLAGRRPVVLVSVRNLPYDWVVTLVAEGNLPFFERAIQQSFSARVEPFTTTSSKELWASLATGQLPHRHGVTGGYSYRTPLNAPDERFLLLPSGVGFRVWGLIPPVERVSAQLPAGQSLPVWTMFERLGIETAVINWPGAAVSPFVRETAALPADALLRFGGTPAARGRVTALLREDYQAAQAAAAAIASGRALTAVALNGLAAAQSELRSESNILPAATTPAGATIRAYVAQIDAIVGNLAAADPRAQTIIVSASGPDPSTFPGSPLGIARWLLEQRDPGRDDGFVLISGPGVRPQETGEAARITDVVPTVLFAAGLPVARDLDGRALTEAFDAQFLRNNSLSIIQTYEAEQILVRRAGA